MPDKKILLILTENGDVKGKVVNGQPKLDPVVKWLLIVTAVLVAVGLGVIVVRPLRHPVRSTPLPTPSVPALAIQPPRHNALWLGRPVRVRVAGHVEAAITRLELQVNGVGVDAVIPTPIGPTEIAAAGGARRVQAVTELVHTFNWTPRQPGEVVLEVVVFTAGSQPVTTAPVTYYVADNREAVQEVLRQIGPSPTPTWTPLAGLTVPTQPPAPAAPTGAPGTLWAPPAASATATRWTPPPVVTAAATTTLWAPPAPSTPAAPPPPTPPPDVSIGF